MVLVITNFSVITDFFLVLANSLLISMHDNVVRMDFHLLQTSFLAPTLQTMLHTHRSIRIIMACTWLRYRDSCRSNSHVVITAITESWLCDHTEYMAISWCGGHGLNQLIMSLNTLPDYNRRFNSTNFHVSVTSPTNSYPQQTVTAGVRVSNHCVNYMTASKARL